MNLLSDLNNKKVCYSYIIIVKYLQRQGGLLFIYLIIAIEVSPQSFTELEASFSFHSPTLWNIEEGQLKKRVYDVILYLNVKNRKSNCFKDMLNLHLLSKSIGMIYIFHFLKQLLVLLLFPRIIMLWKEILKLLWNMQIWTSKLHVVRRSQM